MHLVDGNFLIGFLCPKLQKEGIYMNRNPKEKTRLETAIYSQVKNLQRTHSRMCW